jgi:hypothetical protein
LIKFANFWGNFIFKNIRELKEKKNPDDKDKSVRLPGKL